MIKDKKIVVECECGTHMLHVTSASDMFYESSGVEKEYRSIYLAMFNYGNQKRGFWQRLGVAFRYLKTGNMYSDQITMNKEEAQKLADFLNENILKD